MTQHVVIALFQAEFPHDLFILVLISPRLHVFPPGCQQIAVRPFSDLSEIDPQKRRKGDLTEGVLGFRHADLDPGPSALLLVKALDSGNGLPDIEHSFTEVNILPFQGADLSDPKSCIKRKDHSRPDPFPCPVLVLPEKYFQSSLLLLTQDPRLFPPLLQISDLTVVRDTVFPLFCETQHHFQDPQDAVDRPCLQVFFAQFLHKLRDTLCCQFFQAACPDQRHDVMEKSVIISRHRRDLHLCFSGFDPFTRKLFHSSSLFSHHCSFICTAGTFNSIILNH